MANRKTKKPKRDVAQEVTNQIIKKLENGVKPWYKPWDSVDVGPARRHNGEPYRGINSLILSMDAADNARTSPFYMTYDQAKKLGGQVQKGQKSLPVVYYSSYNKEVENDKGEKDTKKLFFMNHYNVFNADQIDGLPEKFFPKPDPVKQNRQGQTNADPDVANALDEMTQGLQLKGGYREQGGRAFYRPSDDSITMPKQENFPNFYEYAGTRIHEMAHATEVPDRLDMNWGRKKSFGNTSYAKGELYAEMTSCFSAAEMGFVAENIDNSTAYLGSWIKALKSDKNAIFKMTSSAQKGSEHLLEMTSEFNKEKREESYLKDFKDDTKNIDVKQVIESGKFPSEMSEEQRESYFSSMNAIADEAGLQYRYISPAGTGANRELERFYRIKSDGEYPESPGCGVPAQRIFDDDIYKTIKENYREDPSMPYAPSMQFRDGNSGKVILQDWTLNADDKIFAGARIIKDDLYSKRFEGNPKEPTKPEKFGKSYHIEGQEDFSNHDKMKWEAHKAKHGPIWTPEVGRALQAEKNAKENRGPSLKDRYDAAHTEKPETRKLETTQIER